MANDLLGLTGQAALVTGAGQGAGRGIAGQLARAGANVAVADLDPDRAEQVADEIRGLGVGSTAIRVDVRDESSVANMVSAVRDAFGSLDVLVNNVGNYGGHAPAPITSIDWDFWKAAIDLNLRSTFLCSQAAARMMQSAARGGAIVNIASLSGLRASPNRAPYGAVKAGVIQLTQTLALELAPDRIRVNCIAPTGIDGPSLREAVTPESIEAMRASLPLGELCTPESLGDCVLMLASRLARNVTGQVVLCDGGASITTQRISPPLGEGQRPDLER